MNLPDWMTPTPTRTTGARTRPRAKPKPKPKRAPTRQATPTVPQLEMLTLRLGYGLSAAAMARYMGVPVFTYRKWEAGTREPNASVLRLLEVLRLISDHAPKLHNQLIQEAKK